MSNIDDGTRLRHMRDAAIEARSFVENRTRQDLDSDRMLALALVKDIEIIGEAANRVSADCKAKYTRAHPNFAELPSSPNPCSQNRRRGARFKVPLPKRERDVG